MVEGHNTRCRSSFSGHSSNAVDDLSVNLKCPFATRRGKPKVAADNRVSWSLNTRISRPPSKPRILFTNADRLFSTSITGELLPQRFGVEVSEDQARFGSPRQADFDRCSRIGMQSAASFDSKARPRLAPLPYAARRRRDCGRAIRSDKKPCAETQAAPRCPDRSQSARSGGGERGSACWPSSPRCTAGRFVDDAAQAHLRRVFRIVVRAVGHGVSPRSCLRRFARGVNWHFVPCERASPLALSRSI